MLLDIPLYVLLLTSISLSTPLRKSSRYSKHIPWTRRLPSFDRQVALAAQAATRLKFQNAPALLAGVGTSPGYSFPSSLQIAYNHASDYATNISLLSSLTSPQPFYSPFTVRVAVAGSLQNANATTVDSLQDDTDGINDYEYFGIMGFGSEAQPLQIDFDTGSADLWVPVSCTDCGTLTSFRASASSTYRNTYQPFNVVYGSGFVSGTLAQDTVSVGPFKVYNQTVGAVQSVSTSFADSPNDGLAGMAFGTIATSHKSTFFENLMPQLQAPLFSFYMTRKQPHGSEIYLGGIDVSKTNEDTIQWVPVISKTYWTVNMTAAEVNNTRVQIRVFNAIIDTGTSFIYLPTQATTAIYSMIPGAKPAPDYDNGFYAYPCNTPITVSFVLGPHTLPLDPRDLNLGLYETDPTGSMCVAAIVDAGPSLSFGIIGDSFLKSFVSIFDYSHGARVGFVKSIDE